MKEYKVGETFVTNGVEIICLPHHDSDKSACSRCLFARCLFSHKPHRWCKELACARSEREDENIVYFRPLSDMGDDFHYSRKLDRVVAFKPTESYLVGMACRKCVLGKFKPAIWAGCEGALCIGIMRKDRQDGYFVDLDEI